MPAARIVPDQVWAQLDPNAGRASRSVASAPDQQWKALVAGREQRAAARHRAPVIN